MVRKLDKPPVALYFLNQRALTGVVIGRFRLAAFLVNEESRGVERTKQIIQVRGVRGSRHFEWKLPGNSRKLEIVSIEIGPVRAKHHGFPLSRFESCLPEKRVEYIFLRPFCPFILPHHIPRGVNAQEVVQPRNAIAKNEKGFLK